MERLRKKVYFIRAGDRVKVGVSWNPDQRLDDLRKHNPDVELLGSVDGAFDVERAFHRKLEEHALGNEWFRWCDEVSWVIASAIQMSTSGHLDPTDNGGVRGTVADVQPTATEKVNERRLRRAALRKGLHLRKSNRLDPLDFEFGKWWVVRPPADRPELWRWQGRTLTAADGITLEEVAAFVEAYDGK